MRTPFVSEMFDSSTIIKKKELSFEEQKNLKEKIDASLKELNIKDFIFEDRKIEESDKKK